MQAIAAVYPLYAAAARRNPDLVVRDKEGKPYSVRYARHGLKAETWKQETVSF